MIQGRSGGVGSFLVDRHAMLMVGLGGFAIYAIYPLAYYGITSYSFLNSIKAILFVLFFWMFLSCFSKKAAAWPFVFAVYFAISLGVCGLFVGVHYRGWEFAGLVHLVYYLMFLVVMYIGFRNARYVRFHGDSIWSADGVWRVGVFLSLILILAIHLFRSVSHNPSITFPFLSIAFAYFLWRKNWLLLILCVLALVLSLKRGMWVSIFALGMVLVARGGVGVFLSGRFNKRSFVVLSSVIFVIISFILTFVWFGGPVVDSLLQRLAVSIPSGLSYHSLDAASSGRFGDFFAVYSKVTTDCNVWLGCGFGVEYNYFDYNDPWEITTEWVKSGSDVMFLHFFLLLGVLGLLVYAVFLILFVVSIFGLLRVRWGSVKFFAYACYFLIFLTCLFSFSFFDPMFPGFFGFSLALVSHTDKDLV
jgi:hypothetical protein